MNKVYKAKPCGKSVIMVVATCLDEAILEFMKMKNFNNKLTVSEVK